MKFRNLLLLSSTIVIVVVIFIVGFLSGPTPDVNEITGEYQRIISFAPNITEILFELGARDVIAGITDYCNYPPETAEIPRIGGHFDPAWESIFALKPDLAIMLASSHELTERLESRGVTCLPVPDQNLDDIHQAILLIGAIIDRMEEARELSENIAAGIEEVSMLASDMPRKRVLFIAGRSPGRLRDIYTVSGQSWLGRLISSLGGINIADSSDIPFPELSLEEIVASNPEVIIESRPDLADNRAAPAQARQDWEKLENVQAVKDGNIHIMTESGITIPGPRIADTARLLYKAIHSDAGGN